MTLFPLLHKGCDKGLIIKPFDVDRMTGFFDKVKLVTLTGSENSYKGNNVRNVTQRKIEGP